MTITSGQRMRRISNSEASAWLACQQQYRYAYDLKLEPIPTGASALGTGIATHEGFQAYNRARVAGANHQEALAAEDSHLMSLLSTSGRAHMDDIYNAKIMCSIYHSHYGDEFSHFEIIDAEQRVDLPLTENYSMPLRYDLYYVDKRTGKYVLSDYKTTYDFWTDDRIKLSPQFAKYFAAFRNNNMPVDECRLDQIRTRWKKVNEHSFEELFRRSKVVPSKSKMRSVLKQHILAAEKITEYRALPDEIRPNVTTPVLNWGVCRMCDYKSLCIAELDDLDPTSMNLLIQTEYRQNTYDYNPDDREKMIEELM